MTFKRYFLRALARFTRRVRIPGTERFLLAIHPCEGQRRPIRTEVRLPSGIRFAIDSSSFLEWQMFFFGRYEPAVTEALDRLTEPGDIVIDIGANIGIHAFGIAQSVRPSRVIACEPNPRVFERLQVNRQLNPHLSVEPFQVAITGASGPVSLHVPSNEDANQGIASLIPHDHLEAGSSMQVRGLTLGDAMGELGLNRVDVLKLDTEGSEPSIMRGASEVLATHQPGLVFEFDKDLWQGTSLEETFEFLRSLGYERFTPISTEVKRSLTIDAFQRGLVVAE